MTEMNQFLAILTLHVSMLHKRFQLSSVSVLYLFIDHIKDYES